MKYIVLSFLMFITNVSNAAFFTDPNPTTRYTKAAIASFMLPVAVGINTFQRFNDYSDVPASHAGFLSMIMAGLTAKPWLNAMHFALTRQAIIAAMANNNKIKPLLALTAACQATGISLQALSDQLFMEQ